MCTWMVLARLILSFVVLCSVCPSCNNPWLAPTTWSSGAEDGSERTDNRKWNGRQVPAETPVLIIIIYSGVFGKKSGSQGQLFVCRTFSILMIHGGLLCIEEDGAGLGSVKISLLHIRTSYLDQDDWRIELSLLEITSPLLCPVKTNNKPTAKSWPRPKDTLPIPTPATLILQLRSLFHPRISNISLISSLPMKCDSPWWELRWRATKVTPQSRIESHSSGN